MSLVGTLNFIGKILPTWMLRGLMLKSSEDTLHTLTKTAHNEWQSLALNNSLVHPDSGVRVHILGTHGFCYESTCHVSHVLDALKPGLVGVECGSRKEMVRRCSYAEKVRELPDPVTVNPHDPNTNLDVDNTEIEESRLQAAVNLQRAELERRGIPEQFVTAMSRFEFKPKWEFITAVDWTIDNEARLVLTDMPESLQTEQRDNELKEMRGVNDGRQGGMNAYYSAVASATPVRILDLLPYSNDYWTGYLMSQRSSLPFGPDLALPLRRLREIHARVMLKCNLDMSRAAHIVNELVRQIQIDQSLDRVPQTTPSKMLNRNAAVLVVSRDLALDVARLWEEKFPGSANSGIRKLLET